MIVMLDGSEVSGNEVRLLQLAKRKLRLFVLLKSNVGIDVKLTQSINKPFTLVGAKLVKVGTVVMLGQVLNI